MVEGIAAVSLAAVAMFRVEGVHAAVAVVLGPGLAYVAGPVAA